MTLLRVGRRPLFRIRLHMIYFFGKVPKLGIFTFNYLRRKTNLYVSALAVHCEGR